MFYENFINFSFFMFVILELDKLSDWSYRNFIKIGSGFLNQNYLVAWSDFWNLADFFLSDFVILSYLILFYFLLSPHLSMS